MGKQYQIFANSEDGYPLRKKTLGLYEKYKMLLLKCSFVDPVAKAFILTEFGMTTEDYNSKEKLNVKDYYVSLVYLIFEGVPERIENPGELDLSVIAEASDFLFPPPESKSSESGGKYLY